MAEPQYAIVPALPPGQRHHLFGATEVHRNLNELKLNFNNVVSKWKYEGLESFSVGAVVVRLGVKEGHITKTRYRRLVIKRALTDDSEDTLRNEIETIQVRGLYYFECKVRYANNKVVIAPRRAHHTPISHL